MNRRERKSSRRDFEQRVRDQGEFLINLPMKLGQALPVNPFADETEPSPSSSE